MRYLSSVLLATVILWFWVGVAEAASTPRQTTWEDLAPPMKKLIEDPLAHLDPFIRLEISEISFAIRQHKNGLISPVSEDYETAMEAKYRLERDGIEVENILSRIEAIQAEILRWGEQMVYSLDGQFIKIPGYALPIEFDGVAVKEFLLVPYVGACIHVPPPPKNQMIFVELREPFAVDSLFEPVWVVGRILVKDTRKTLPVSDGEIPIRAGYLIENGNVEPYRE